MYAPHHFNNNENCRVSENIQWFSRHPFAQRLANSIYSLRGRGINLCAESFQYIQIWSVQHTSQTFSLVFQEQAELLIFVSKETHTKHSDQASTQESDAPSNRWQPTALGDRSGNPWLQYGLMTDALPALQNKKIFTQWNTYWSPLIWYICSRYGPLLQKGNCWSIPLSQFPGEKSNL